MNGKRDSLLAQNSRAILRAALASDHGTEVEVGVVGDIPTPILRAKAVLYRFKKEDSAFDCLKIFQSPDNNYLWITKQSFGDDSDAQDL